MSDIEKIRRAVELFDGCSEEFNSYWNYDQLFRVAETYFQSDWTYRPDEWPHEVAIIASGNVRHGVSAVNRYYVEQEG